MKEDTLATKIVGVLLAIPLVGLALYWYNYIWIQFPFPYWKCVILSIPVLFIPEKIRSIIMLFLFISALILQTLSWLGAVKFPVL
jgi:hypothetical protein